MLAQNNTMDEIIEIIKAVINAPLPTLFIVAGVLFLLIAVVGNIRGTIEPGTKGRIASGVLGLTFVLTGLYILYTVPNPQPTREFLTGRSWAFLHVEGDVISPRIQLDPSGAIRGVDHPNESRWALENGKLVFFNLSGEASTRFTEIEREGGKLVLSGKLLLPGHQTVVIHVLKEL